MPYIKVIDYSEAAGDLKTIYDDLIKSRGKLAEVHKIQSLNPQSIVNHMDLYMTVMFGKSPLKRQQREMIAVVVSVANHCEYCTEHHGAALAHFWKDEERLKKFKTHYKDAGLEEKDIALCDYARTLTRQPRAIDKQAHIDRMKSLGLTDRAVLDAALVTAYFNFVNRLVMGLGVTLEKEAGQGYHYD